MRVLEYPIGDDSERISVRAFLKKQGFPNAVLSHLRGDEEALLCRRRDQESSLFLPGDEGSCLWQKIRLVDLVHPGDTLRVILKEGVPSSKVIPTELPLDILYEDEDILVVNKPAGLPMHSSPNHYEKTLANAAAWHFRQQGENPVFRCTNRLDKNTTGVTVIAKNQLSAAVLAEAVRRREVKREYLAIAEGITEPHGIIDAPIGRVPGSVILRQVDLENGEEAITEYERLAILEAPAAHEPSEETGCAIPKHALSLLRIRLQTGRTHQIRVHMKWIGHPLPGDFLYHPDFTLISRQPLHSRSMSFLHPITREPLCFTASLPGDMQALLAKAGPGKDALLRLLD